MVRFSPDPAAPEVEIQWFFVDDLPGTIPLGMYTRFASGNWANEHTCPAAWTGPGEVSPFPTDRPWVRGGRLVDAVCSGQPIGSPSQFAGNIAWPWVPLPANACCLPRAQAAAPRFRWGFAADAVPQPPPPPSTICLFADGFYGSYVNEPFFNFNGYHTLTLQPPADIYWNVMRGSSPYTPPYAEYSNADWEFVVVAGNTPDPTWLAFHTPGNPYTLPPILPLTVVPGFRVSSGVPPFIQPYDCGSPSPPNPIVFSLSQWKWGFTATSIVNPDFTKFSYKWAFDSKVIPVTPSTFSYKWAFVSKVVPQLPLSFNYKWNFRADTMPYPTGDPCSNLSVPTPLAFVWDGPGWSGGPAGTCDLVLATRVILGQDPGNPCRWTATGGPFDFGSGPENWYYELLLYGPNQVSFNVTSDFGSIESYWGTNLWDGSLPIVIPMDAEFSSVCTLNSFTDSIVYPSPT